MSKIKQGLGSLLLVLLLTILGLMSLLQPTVALAEEAGTVRLAVQPGLSGIYKLGLPTGLQVSIANQGEAFTGLLVVEPGRNILEKGPSQQGTRYQRVVQVPAGSLAKTMLMVPSEMINDGATVVLLAGDKPVAVSPVQGTVVNGGFIALSLGEKPLKGGIAAWFDQSFGGQTTIKYLSPKALPEDPLELVLADIIIVDDHSVAELTTQQLATLKDWTSLGGMLIISGGAGAASGGPLADLSPVLAEAQQTVAANLGGLQVVKGNMNVTTGPLQAGEARIKVNGVVVVASREYGKGQVIYSGIPLENLTSESAAVWPLVFGNKIGQAGINVKMQMAQEKRQMGNDSLAQAATYLPQIKTPPIPKVAVAWVFYVLVLGPGFYLLLKRCDKRDWMWWLIPTCALLTTGVVYLMSPAQRINAPISQTLAVVEILDDKRAEVNATAAFVSPYGGNLDIEGPREAIVWPANSYYPQNKGIVIEYNDVASPKLSFSNVEYWSMRHARATAVKKDMGQISGSLSLENGTLQGTIENQTKINLRDCRILLGGRSLAVGNLPAGGNLTVNQSLTNWPGSLGPNEFRDLLIPPAKPGEQDAFVRERQMVDTAMGSRMQEGSNQPVFFGWSDDSLQMFKILSDKANVSEHHLMLVTQNLQLTIPLGQTVELPSGMYLPKVTDSRGAFNQTPLGITLYEGKVTLEYNLLGTLNKQNFRVDGLTFPAQTNKYLTLRVYDWQENKWTDMPSDGLRIGAEELKRYGSTAGEFRFQVEKMAGAGNPDKVDLPVVTVRGVAVQ